METTGPDIAQQLPLTDTATQLRQGLPVVSQLVLPVSVRSGCLQMTVNDLCRLAPGTVLSLDLPCDSPQHLVANGRALAAGELVRHDGRLGFRLGRLSDGVVLSRPHANCNSSQRKVSS